jgi:hypothetical protein
MASQGQWVIFTDVNAVEFDAQITKVNIDGTCNVVVYANPLVDHVTNVAQGIAGQIGTWR